MDSCSNADCDKRPRTLPSFFFSSTSSNKVVSQPKPSSQRMPSKAKDKNSASQSTSSPPATIPSNSCKKDHSLKIEHDQFPNFILDRKVEISTEPRTSKINLANVEVDESLSINIEEMKQEIEAETPSSFCVVKTEEKSDMDDQIHLSSSPFPIPKIVNTMSLNDKSDESDNHLNSPLSTIPSLVSTTTQTNLRRACQYGRSCYRRNPQHKADFSHPGDHDYPEPTPSSSDNTNKPVCSFGSRCYRQNPDHTANFSHSMQTALEPKRNRKTRIDLSIYENDTDELEDFSGSSDEDVYDSSFIIDDDDEDDLTNSVDFESELSTPDELDDEDTKKRTGTNKRITKRKKL